MVELTDYIGQGVTYFRVEPSRVSIGDTITASWEVTEGESVTLVYRNPEASSSMLNPDEDIPPLATFTDLPLTGRIEIMIPDDPHIRSNPWGSGYLWLYIIEDGQRPTIPDWSASFLYDLDGNSACHPDLYIDTSMQAQGEVTTTWDSCGISNTFLRLALVTGGYGAEPVSEEYLMIQSSGTQTIALPNATGTFHIDLIYEYQGTYYPLRFGALELTNTDG